MIVKKQFLDQIKEHFNLNIYEVKIWTALLSRGIATAGSLSEIGDVPRSRSYDVLESLEKKGFIVMKLGKPIKYIAVKPEEILQRMKKEITKETEERTKVIDGLKGTELFTELEMLHTQGIALVDPSLISSSVVGRRNVYSKMKYMIENAKESIVIGTTGEGLVRKLTTLKNSLKRASKKGVEIKVIAPVKKEHDVYIKKMKDVVTVRHSKDSIGRFLIADGKELIFMMSNDEQGLHQSYDTGVWVNSPYFTTAVETMFNMHWDSLE